MQSTNAEKLAVNGQSDNERDSKYAAETREGKSMTSNLLNKLAQNQGLDVQQGPGKQ